MKQLSDLDIRDLVAKAFIIEAVTDKPGCTTRYKDAPGKPLEDFLLAGINVSRYFKAYTKDQAIFTENPGALRASNQHKSDKYINFGLLEILYPTVAARSLTSKPEDVVPMIIELMKKAGKEDVEILLECRQIAWGTSRHLPRTNFRFDSYKNCHSPYEFYMKLIEHSEEASSEYQWGMQYKLGLPILRHFFEAYMEAGEYMKTTTRVFQEMLTQYPRVAKGIHADMCAAALFLYFSYTE